MKGFCLFIAPALLTLGLTTTSGMAGTLPADLYFSFAVTENSHNHQGNNLLFLDFQEQADPARISPQVVISPRIEASALRMDGRLDDWNPAWFTTIAGRVMNNYPLSEFYDATPGPIQIASAHDDRFLYFAVRFEDANHDASINRRRWVFDGSTWQKSKHVPIQPDTPAASVINRDHDIAGDEDEDQVFFMFPMVDKERAFRDGGLGCGAYCHPNLVDSGAPGEHLIGEETAGMHTSLPGDVADLWHWTSTRSHLGNTLKDGYLVYGDGIFNGRLADAGQAPDQDNDQKAANKEADSQPGFISRKDHQAGNYGKPGFRTEILDQEDAMPIEPGMTFASGVSIPYSIRRPATGGRSDVTVMAHFDPESHFWTLEFKRALVSGDPNDRAFVPGPDAKPPAAPPVVPGDVENGKKLFADHCASCHGKQGEGRYEKKEWIAPRNQRASGPLIAKTASIDRIKRQRTLAHEIQPAHLMAFVPLTRQQSEDIASWLQRQQIRE
ncbi:MAG: c-type cytochrome [Magnetococcales bacterium]|nr:c-type cytochrome [Magnetococcales bacterium]